MTDKDNAVIDALGRVNRFAIPRLADFEVGSLAITHFTRAGVIAAALTPSDSKPGTPASPVTGARNHLFHGAWDDLLAIAETARTISRTEPGFSADFRLDGDTHQEIIATATAFLKKLQVPTNVDENKRDHHTFSIGCVPLSILAQRPGACGSVCR